MSVLAARPMDAAEERHTARELGRASFRVKVVKIVCGIALGVCFWYSVPYAVPPPTTNGVANAASALAENYAGSNSRQVAMPVIALLAAYMLWRLPKRGRIGGRLVAVALLYIGWAIVSCAWSTVLPVTEKRLIVFLMDCLFAYTAARTLSVMELALWGFASTGVVALISLYVDVAQQHSFAPFDPEYRFQGVMQPNNQAMNLVVCIVCALTLAQQRPRLTRWLAPVVIFALALLALSRSRLSTILCIGMVLAIVMPIAKRKLGAHTRAIALLAGLAVGAPLLILVIGSSNGSAAQSVFMMGRNDTENTSSLSNRMPLWTELMGSVVQHPWFGFGYEAFWTPERVERVSLDQGWAVPHGHNTYLDQMLSLGVVGMLLYMGAVGGGCVVAWRRYRHRRRAESLLPALLITWMMIESLAESTPLDPYLPTILAYICVVKMFLAEGSEAESDRARGPREIMTGVSPVKAGSAW